MVLSLGARLRVQVAISICSANLNLFSNGFEDVDGLFKD